MEEIPEETKKMIGQFQAYQQQLQTILMQKETMKLIISMTGRSDNTARRWLKECVEAGLITEKAYRREVGLKITGRRTPSY